MVIPTSLQHHAVSWYHHCLQHSRGHVSQENSSSLNVLERSKKDSPITCQKVHSCQVNKYRQHKCGKLPTKLVITTPLEVSCVDLIGPYNLKGKGKTVIDFMHITMIDPATSWFKIVELLISQPSDIDIPMGTKEHKGKDTHIQQKHCTLTNCQQHSGQSSTGIVSTLTMTIDVNLNFISRPSVNHTV